MQLDPTTLKKEILFTEKVQEDFPERKYRPRRRQIKKATTH